MRSVSVNQISVCAPDPDDRQSIILEGNGSLQVIEMATAGTEGKGPDANRIISMLHECWKPRVFDSVTVAEESQVSSEEI